MTDEKKAKLLEQLQHLPDYDVKWLWLQCQRELERRDEAWPKAKSWRALAVPQAVHETPR